MDISEFTELDPQKPREEGGGISAIGSRAWTKKALERRWEALDTIFVEMPRGELVFTPKPPPEPVNYTLQDMRDLTARLILKGPDEENK